MGKVAGEAVVMGNGRMVWVITKKGENVLKDADKIYKKIESTVKGDMFFGELMLANQKQGLEKK